ncbi:MAG: HAMP domain-containing histidine kinase [Ruminococcaceae bacterium]|nr:HAMP domain-containing histidine kinase [Oscillospiraceae bacterium]
MKKQRVKLFSKLFLKFYLRIAVILLCSFAFISVMIFILLFKQNYEIKQKELVQVSKRVADTVSSFYEFPSSLDERAFKNTLSFFSDSTDCMIFITDVTGDIWAYVGSSTPPKQISHNLIEQTYKDGILTHMGKLDNLLQRKSFCVAIPYYSRGGSVLGVVVMAYPFINFYEPFKEITLISVLAVLAALFVSYVVMYVVVERMLRPIKAMSMAVKEMANGDFSRTIPVIGTDEISELSESFNEMAHSLGELEEMRYSFISNVSHELKTPMTTISGFVDGMLDGTIPLENHGHYLEIVSNESKRLTRLVNTLLDATRISEGKVKFNMIEFDVCSMITDIAETLQMEFDKKDIKVFVNVAKNPLVTVADEDAIYRVVYNIAENAIKFTQPGGKISFSVATDNKKIFVGIKNTGEGIKQTDIPYVFDRFFKADKSRGVDAKGVGLGLYMAKQIIKAHKENIWVNSVYKEYAEFVFTLPLK